MTASATLRDAPKRVSERDPGRLAMWIFLATELLFFGGVFAAYLYGRTAWPQGFGLASRHTDVVLGTLNTGLLLSSSALVALAAACAQNARHAHWTARLLSMAAWLGVAFLVVKGLEYRREWHAGLFPVPGFALAGTDGAALFFMLYFTATALHALHLAVGIGVLAVFARGCARRRAWADAHRIDIAALYWHFVDVVWIFLYPLLYLVERHT
ncbi:MAG: cytochrome c oxidase subunit 3 [Rubrivivax sp.]|nr:cytochrome c oxidase subunit 3 [Rubrivivax sp.]